MSEPLIIHASTVAYQGQAVALIGPSGSGKSSLALQMIGLGAVLVADDRTILTATSEALVARCPDPLLGMIEAHGIGLLHAPMAGPTQLAFVVDLSQEEPARLPPLREVTYLDHKLPLLWARRSPNFAAAVFHMLAYGRSIR